MPYVHSAEFRVRHYECDALGHLSHANYARYMQEAALDATAAIGYDAQRYESLNLHWLIHETHIDYVSPLHFGDVVQVKTWVGDFRRVRSQRYYEFYRGEEQVARAQTDWVLLDRISGQPTIVPPEIIAAYTLGEPSVSKPRERFPHAPPPPTGVYVQRRRVLWTDIDSEQHVNNARYLDYIGDAGMEMSAAYGWTIEKLRAAGFVIIAHGQHIEYKQPAKLDDEIEIATWVYDVRRATATRAFRITRGETLLAQVRSMLVAVHPETGQPVRIPQQYLADFDANIVKNL